MKLKLTVLALGLTVACNKPAADDKSATAPAAPVQPAAPAVQPSADDEGAARERAEKEGALAFATQEDAYINDAKGQWATSAKASSTFGDEDGRTPEDSNLAKNVTGTPDGKSWTNNKQDMGFDTIEAQFAKPVTATEVRIVVLDGVEAISKVEVGDGSTWTTVWTGLSDVKKDGRGPRTWFTKKFEPTKAKASAVKVTFANQVERGYKVVEAVQLIGE